MKFGILLSSLRGPKGRSNLGLFAFFFTFLLSPALVFATPQVPRTIVFQGILVDAGGNPLTDVPSANANISIVDGAGETRYEEQQNITIYQGATAFLVGMGINPDTGELTGGIPLDVMEPGEGDLILKIKIEGQTIAQEDVILASVPFSFYSQYATELTQQIESDQIKDGAITVSHLSEEVTTYVKSLGVSKEELEEHKTEKAAHTATSISVNNTFKNLTGTDLQMLMESVDYGITLANKGSEYLKETLLASIANAVAAHEAKELTTAHPNGNLPATRISGTIATAQIADKAITTEKIVDGAITASKLDQTYLSTEGGTLNGNLNMQT